MMLLSAGCATGERPLPARNFTGELRYLSVPLYLNVPLEYGNLNATVTVETPQGPKTVQLAANTTYIIDGKLCLPEDVGKLLNAANTSYVCTIVIEENCNFAQTLYIEKK